MTKAITPTLPPRHGGYRAVPKSGDTKSTERQQPPKPPSGKGGASRSSDK
jgi:hypothetical protein